VRHRSAESHRVLPAEGIFIDVPGGSTIAAMKQQMLDAFSQIAAKVPPAQ